LRGYDLKKVTKVLSIIALIAVMALSVPFVTSCIEVGQTETEVTDLVITDDAGKTYSFEEPVDSIVSMAPSVTEIVYFVDAGDKLIGRTDYCNFPDAASAVESIGGYYDPNLEKIVILDPDVVLADNIHISTGAIEWLQSQGLTVILIDPKNIGDIMDDIMLVGEITGNTDIAAERVSTLESRVDAVTNAISGLSDEDKPSVLHVTWYDPLWTSGDNSFQDMIIELAGGVNIFSDVSGDVEVDLEQAVIRNPDVITVISDMGKETSYHYIVAEGSPFAATDAYINDRIYIVDSDIVGRPGPRMVDALELYSKLLHPELFS
jgi:iron complex transport system substrate-binding protein